MQKDPPDTGGPSKTDKELTLFDVALLDTLDRGGEA